jgi:hypothetical protein
MRNLDSLLTSEMNQEEWQEFRRLWVARYTKKLVRYGYNLVTAEALAPGQFEDCVNFGGFAARDEDIRESRVMRPIKSNSLRRSRLIGPGKKCLYCDRGYGLHYAGCRRIKTTPLTETKKCPTCKGTGRVKK